MHITPLTSIELNQLIEEQLRSPIQKQRVEADQPAVVVWRAPSCWIWDCYCGAPAGGGRSSGSSKSDGKADPICLLVLACIVLIVSTFVALKQAIEEGSVADKQGRKIRQLEVTVANPALKEPLLFLLKDHYSCSVARTTSWGIATVGFAFLTAAVLFAIYMHSTRGNHFISESLTRGCFITGGSAVALALLLRGGHEIMRAGEAGKRDQKKAQLSYAYEQSRLPVQPVIQGVHAGPQVIQGVAVAPPNYIIPPGYNAYQHPVDPSAPPAGDPPPYSHDGPPPPYNPAAKEI